MTALNKAAGWIIAVWLFLAACSSGYAPYICMAGAMVTVVIWAAIQIAFARLAPPTEAP